MSNLLEKKEILDGKYTANIYVDDCMDVPINNGNNVGEYIYCGKKYNFGNKKFKSIEEIDKYIKRKINIVFPWYMYEHSGIGFSLNNNSYPFNCPWDAGQIGYIVVPKKTAIKEWGKNFTQEQVENYIKAELMEYQHYINNDFLCISIQDEKGEIIDSCGAIIDADEFIEEFETKMKEKQNA